MCFIILTQIEKIKNVHEKKKSGRDEVMKELQEIRKEVSEVEKEKEEILKRKREIEKQLRSGKVGGVTTPIFFFTVYYFCIKSEGTSINREIEKVKREKKAFEEKLEESRKQ